MQMEARSHQYHQYNHVLEHCILFILIALLARIEVQLELEATPFVEDTVTLPRQQGKQPPFDHVDKIPFPSHSLMHD